MPLVAVVAVTKARRDFKDLESRFGYAGSPARRGAAVQRGAVITITILPKIHKMAADRLTRACPMLYFNSSGHKQREQKKCRDS